MKKCILSFLLVTLYAPAMLAVTITTSGDQQSAYTSEAAIATLRQCQTINNLLGDLGDQEDIVVPLTTIPQPCWLDIFACLQILNNDKLDIETKKKDIDEKISNLTQEEVFALIAACEFLQVPDALLDRAFDPLVHNPEILLFTDALKHLSPNMQAALKKKLARHIRRACMHDKQKEVLRRPVLIKELTETDHTKRITQYSFGCGNELVGSFHDGSIGIWDILSSSMINKFKAHAGSISTVTQNRTAKRWNIASKSNVDHSIKIWNMNTGQCEFTFPTNLAPLFSCFIADDHAITINNHEEGSITIIDLDTKKIVNTFQHPHITHLDVCADRLATVADNGLIYIWDIKTGENIRIIDNIDPKIHALYWPRQKSDILIVHTEDVVCIWNAVTGELVESLPTRQAKFDQKHVLYTKDNDIIRHDYHNKKDLQIYKGHDQQITKINSHNDGNFLVSTSVDGTARIWNESTGDAIHILHHEGPVKALSILADGNYLVTITQNNKLHLWDFMGSRQAIIDKSSLEQLLFLTFGYKRKNAQKNVIINNTRLKQFVDAYNKEHPAFFEKIIPLNLKFVKALALAQRLQSPLYEHTTSIRATAAGALGLAWHQKAGK